MGIIQNMCPTPLPPQTLFATTFTVVKPHQKPARKWRRSGGSDHFFLVGGRPPDPLWLCCNRLDFTPENRGWQGFMEGYPGVAKVHRPTLSDPPKKSPVFSG